ncbi:Alpha/beta hydrolase fold-1 [Dichotomopilus funicola]|uniref:Alpha/beta hydrolase fold-1 n=1 Tax=Dichotomopilus funicola TaxID=1934379 RepID=A0AAN6UYW4_9PEZI|nr:Alpha/beta hydrolase fold-1 [Dichotomopilus funicola]
MTTPNPQPLIVIIPGGFHRPAHYTSIITPLQSQGYTVLSVPLVVCGDAEISPDATPADDVKALHNQLLPLLDQGNEAILVAHSYGSMVATAAIQNQTKADRSLRGLAGGIVGIVSIAGFAFPVRGKSISGGEEEMGPLPYQVLKDGLLSLTEAAKPLFYSDLSPDAADAAFASICKFQSHKSLNYFPQFLESEITVPKLYVLCERDQTIPPAFQEVMVQVGKFDKVARVQAGHSPFLSVPGEVVDVIVGFGNEVVRR